MLLDLYNVTCCSREKSENPYHISSVPLLTSTSEASVIHLSLGPFPTLHRTDLIKVTASRAELKLHCSDTHEGPEGSVSDNMQQQQLLPIHNCVIIRGSGDSTNVCSLRGPPGEYLQP